MLPAGAGVLNLKVWGGVLISLFCLWFSAKDVDFAAAWRYTQSINLWYVVPFLILTVAEVMIRAWKWQVLLQPIKKCSFLTLNTATLIGLFANNVLPARAGEFVRAYAGARMTGIAYSTSFATVVVDRLLDGLTVSAIFVAALTLQPLPDQIKLAGYGAAVIYLVGLVVLVGLIVQESTTLTLLSRLLRPFPKVLREFVLRTLRTFVEGLGVFRSAGLLASATIISVFIWLGYALSLYITFLAFNIQLSVGAAFVVLLILTIVLTLPSSPGFVGAMELAITFGLGLFGIDNDQAFAVAVVYHVFQYVPITVGGLIALWLARLSVGEIAHVQGPPEEESTESGPSEDEPPSAPRTSSHEDAEPESAGATSGYRGAI